MQVPLAQLVGPVQLQTISSTLLHFTPKTDTHPVPPHCPYNGEPVPVDAVDVACEEVVVEDVTLVVKVVGLACEVDDAAEVDEPPAPQKNGVGPGISYVVSV